MPQPKLKAGALLSVLSMAIIIALLLGLMLLLLFYGRNNTLHAIRKHKLERNLVSATIRLLNSEYNSKDVAINKSDLFDDGTDSVIIKNHAWGIYGIGAATAFENQDSIHRAFMIGKSVITSDQYALYLQDDERPLSLSGGTIIRGTAYLPPAGVRKAYIEDKQYEADSTIYGLMKTSVKKLPILNKDVINHLEQLFIDSMFIADQLAFDAIKDSLSRSFFHEPIIIVSKDSISLDNLILSGAIILKSEKAIHVPASAILEDVILLAPAIHFASEVKARVQAFALDSIIVDKQCVLDYPSALGIIESGQATASNEIGAEIRIAESSLINGVIFTTDNHDDPEFMNKITLQSKARVVGDVYAAGLLELKGIVHGSVTCKRFILQTPSSLYDNFLLDAVIDYPKRSQYYLSSPLIAKGQNMIVQWLD